MGIRLRKDQVAATARHAQEEYPNECCGLLAGKDGIVAEVYRATNVDHSPYTYLMDPAEQLKFFKEMEARGWELVGIYHSHTHSQADPSRTDVEKAFYPEAVYVIVSLRKESMTSIVRETAAGLRRPLLATPSPSRVMT